MSELSRIVRVMAPAMLSLPIDLAEAAMAAPDGLERSLRTVICGLERARDDLLASIKAQSSEELKDPTLDLERLIDELLETERALAEVRDRIQVLSKKMRDDVSHVAPELRPLAQQLRVLLDSICVDALIYLRDRRWDAMMIQAEREPREKDGEVIDTPEGFHAWFASLVNDAPPEHE
jgi:hypothetical protein